MGAGRLVLMVEGESELLSVPKLVSRMLPPNLRLSGKPFQIGGVSNLVHRRNGAWELVKNKHGDGCPKWHSFLRNARDSHVLLLLDGDGSSDSGRKFCAWDAARFLAQAAQEVGAGAVFSLAVVFVRQEFESWLLAGCPELSKQLDDAELSRLEEMPRDAKKRIRDIVKGGYREVIDQPKFTGNLDVTALRSRMRSFRRFENALKQLADAAEDGHHVCTPSKQGECG